MCIYLRVCMHIYTCIYMYLYIYIYIYISIYICTPHGCRRQRQTQHRILRVCVCVYIYVYIYTYPYIYIHTYIPHECRRQKRTQHRCLGGPCPRGHTYWQKTIYMYISICVCVHIYIYMYISICACVHVYIYMPSAPMGYVNMHICICVCAYTYWKIYIYMYTCPHTHIKKIYIRLLKKKYIYVYTYTYTYTYIHIYIPHGCRRQKRTQHRGLEGPCQFQLACPLEYFRKGHLATQLWNCLCTTTAHLPISYIGNYYTIACIIYIWKHFLTFCSIQAGASSQKPVQTMTAHLHIATSAV